MKKWLVAFLLICTSLTFAADETSVSLKDGMNYTVDGTTYLVRLGSEDAIILEQDGRGQILRVDSCLEHPLIRACLDSASETSATMVETNKVAVLEVEHELTQDTLYLGGETRGTITLTKEGELTAADTVARLNIPDGLTLSDGSTGRVTLSAGQVKSDKELRYTLVADSVGAFTISGVVEYFDGNDTISEPLENLTLEVETPIEYTVTYNNTTGVDPTELQVTVERLVSENLSVIIDAHLPPEANVTSKNKGAYLFGTNVSYKRFLNFSETSLNVTYSLLAPPSLPLQLFITYYNSSESYTLAENFSYENIVDTRPALAVSVDPMVENRTGTLRVIITGNRTGTLSIESTLLNKTVSTKADTYDFPLTPAAPGVYGVKVSFTSIDPYGGPHTAKGVVSVTVQAAPSTNQSHTILPETKSNETEQTPVTESTPEQQAMGKLIWIGLGSAVVTFAILLYVAKKISDPVAKLEHLVYRASQIRESLEKAGQLGNRHTPQYQQLERLERKIAEQQKKLLSTRE